MAGKEGWCLRPMSKPHCEKSAVERVDRCSSYCSAAGIKHHDKRQLKGGFMVYGLRGRIQNSGGDMAVGSQSKKLRDSLNHKLNKAEWTESGTFKACRQWHASSSKAKALPAEDQMFKCLGLKKKSKEGILCLLGSLFCCFSGKKKNMKLSG